MRNVVSLTKLNISITQLSYQVRFKPQPENLKYLTIIIFKAYKIFENGQLHFLNNHYDILKVQENSDKYFGQVKVPVVANTISLIFRKKHKSISFEVVLYYRISIAFQTTSFCNV